jgi:DNA-binding NarL/FixJ family response regulator
MVRIIVADAQELLAAGLKAWLSEEADLEVVGYAGSGIRLLELLPTTEADLVLMDVSLPGKDGIDTTRAMRTRFPRVKVLAHSALHEIEYVNSMLIEGASGYLVKGATREEILEAIRITMSGGQYMSEAARHSVEKGYAFTDKRMDGEYIGLTEREREIIRLVALERTNSEIAAALFISEDTVKTHRKHLMTKLNVRSVAGLVKYAIDRRWV